MWSVCFWKNCRVNMRKFIAFRSKSIKECLMSDLFEHQGRIKEDIFCDFVFKYIENEYLCTKYLSYQIPIECTIFIDFNRKSSGLELTILKKKSKWENILFELDTLSIDPDDARLDMGGNRFSMVVSSEKYFHWMKCTLIRLTCDSRLS